MAIEEKEINVINIQEAPKGADIEEYFSNGEATVTRAEMFNVLQQVLGNIDGELSEAFKRVVMTHNLVDVVVKALVLKGLISDEDLSEAQQTLVKELGLKTDEVK